MAFFGKLRFEIKQLKNAGLPEFFFLVNCTLFFSDPIGSDTALNLRLGVSSKWIFDKKTLRAYTRQTDKTEFIFGFNVAKLVNMRRVVRYLWES